MDARDLLEISLILFRKFFIKDENKIRNCEVKYVVFRY